MSNIPTNSQRGQPRRGGGWRGRYRGRPPYTNSRPSNPI